MPFQVEETAYQLIAALRPVMPRIKGQDRALAEQLSRAASSVALNIAESNYSDPGNRRARLFTAAGSANETRAVLRVALESGYCDAAEAAAARAFAGKRGASPAGPSRPGESPACEGPRPRAAQRARTGLTVPLGDGGAAIGPSRRLTSTGEHLLRQ